MMRDGSGRDLGKPQPDGVHASAQASSQASGEPLDSKEVLSRLRLLQSHLCAYAQRSVPVINLNLAHFNDTLDELHDYLLLCIQLALEEDEADRVTGS